MNFSKWQKKKNFDYSALPQHGKRNDMKFDSEGLWRHAENVAYQINEALLNMKMATLLSVTL